MAFAWWLGGVPEGRVPSAQAPGPTVDVNPRASTGRSRSISLLRLGTKVDRHPKASVSSSHPTGLGRDQMKWQISDPYKCWNNREHRKPNSHASNYELLSHFSKKYAAVKNPFQIVLYLEPFKLILRPSNNFFHPTSLLLVWGWPKNSRFIRLSMTNVKYF